MVDFPGIADVLVTEERLLDEASGSFGYPMTVDTINVRGTDAAALAANRGLYQRVRDGGAISSIGLQVTTSSGNISVAAYRNSGSGRNAVPGTRLATSGAVACPSAGFAAVALGDSVDLLPGDWLFLSADNGTAAFRCTLAGLVASSLGAGRTYYQDAAHPAPAAPASLIAAVGGSIALVGVA